MHISSLLVAASLALSAAAPGFAADLPAAPPRLKDAEAQGLPRVSVEELKPFMPGKVMSFGPKGKHKNDFKPDGSVWRSGFREKEGEGKWRFDEKHNAYCNAFFEKKGYSEGCFAVFRAPDGIHFFDYETDTGFYAHTWRPVTEE